jgi:Pyridoxal-phosphate dependent enzyme
VPTRPPVNLRWVDPPADNRARLFVPDRPPSPGPGGSVSAAKALAAGYALGRVLADMLSRALDPNVPVSDLLSGSHHERTARLTAVAASDGNHGPALAWASRLFGCRCVAFVPALVSAGRRAAITDLGADAVEVAGTYDDAVRRPSSGGDPC